MNILQEDKELREIQEMETSYVKACDLHRQYELQVIAKRLQFQENCTHIETYSKIIHKPDPYNSFYPMEEKVNYCKRCGKLIKKEEI